MGPHTENNCLKLYIVFFQNYTDDYLEAESLKMARNSRTLNFGQLKGIWILKFGSWRTWNFEIFNNNKNNVQNMMPGRKMLFLECLVFIIIIIIIYLFYFYSFP